MAKYTYWKFFVPKIRVLAPSVLNTRILFFHAMVDLDHVLNAKVIQLCSESCLFPMSQQFMKPNWKRHTSIVGEGSTKRNEIMKLNFCLHEFRGSATRAVNHLEERGTGIRGCPQILESVRDMY